MWRQFYAGMPFAHLPLFALWLFLAVFVGVCAWIFLVRRPVHFEAAALLPLNDSDLPPTRGTHD